MPTGIEQYQYTPFLLERYVYSLPLWRRILARYFDKFKITVEEFDNWYFNFLIEH
jgi:hypothetical protein